MTATRRGGRRLPSVREDFGGAGLEEPLDGASSDEDPTSFPEGLDGLELSGGDHPPDGVVGASEELRHLGDGERDRCGVDSGHGASCGRVREETIPVGLTAVLPGRLLTAGLQQ